jgi:hypothetical protein
MKKAKLDLRLKKVAELIQLAKRIVTMMTGNVNFTTPLPALVDITAKITALEAAYEDSQSGNHAKVAEMHQLTTELKHMLSFLASYVNNIAQGNEQKIFSSGMEVSKDPEHTGLLPAPADVRLLSGPNAGMVEVRFGKVANAKSYEIESFESGAIPPVQTGGQQTQPVAGINLGINLEDIPWEQSGISTQTKFIIEGLAPGNRIIVRVVAVNTEGKGTWSDPATMIVP